MPLTVGGTTTTTNQTYRPTAISPLEQWTNQLKYHTGGGGALAGGGADNAQVTIIGDDPNRTRYTVLDPYTGQPLYYGSAPGDYANVYAYLQQNNQLPLSPPPGSGGGGGGGGGGGYGGGGGGGGGATYYPQFDYNKAEGRWNRYITQQGFGNQDRQGDWARQYFQQSMLDFNTDWDKKHPAQRIPKEGTTDSKLAPDIAQNIDYNKYLKRAFGNDSLQDIYAGLSGQQRGDNYARYGGGGRVMSWG